MSCERTVVSGRLDISAPSWTPAGTNTQLLLSLQGRFVLVFSIPSSSSSFLFWGLRQKWLCIRDRVIFSSSWRKMGKPKLSCWQKVITGGALGHAGEPGQGRLGLLGVKQDWGWLSRWDAVVVFCFFLLLPALGSNSVCDVEDRSAFLLQVFGFFFLA